MIIVPCASTAWVPPKRPASEAGRPAAMSAASMRRRGAPARGSVSGSAAQGMRPREGIGATATFARCPAECAARILVRTLGLSSISLSGQSSWLADHWKTSRTPSSESTAWRVSSRSRAARAACSQGLRTAAHRPCPWLSRSAISKSVSKISS
jgi:hypothetical protein